MFGISFPELIVVFVVALLAFGPERLPELARKLGKFSAELRRGTDSLRREFYNSVYIPAPDFDRSSLRPLTSEKPKAKEESEKVVSPSTQEIKDPTHEQK